MTRTTSACTLALLAVAAARPATAQESASSSIMAQALSNQAAAAPIEGEETTSSLVRFSMFAIAPPEERVFKPHDLVQIAPRGRKRSLDEDDIEYDGEMEGDHRDSDMQVWGMWCEHVQLL